MLLNKPKAEDPKRTPMVVIHTVIWEMRFRWLILNGFSSHMFPFYMLIGDD
jgi:hypothetical protein